MNDSIAAGLVGPFALGTLAADGEPFAALVVGDQVLDLSSYGAALGISSGASVTTRDLFGVWATALPALDSLSADPSAGWQPLAGLTVLAPIAPKQVLQAGANYRTHVIDLAVAHAELSAGRTVEQVRQETAALMDERAATGIPYFFIGLPSAIGGPFDDVVLPGYSQKHDWELELAAVIGTRAFRVSREEALEHVAAYTIVNDLSTRDLIFRRDMPEIGTDWYRGKNAPGFLPTGPFLVPSDFVGDTSDLQVTLRLNGDVMQDESTSDMIFGVAALVSEASQIAPLLPGDLVLTGSPAGNGMHYGRLLRDGDVVEGTISGLGTQRFRCVAEGSAGAGS